MSLAEYIIICTVVLVWIVLARTYIRRYPRSAPRTHPAPAPQVATSITPSADAFACTVRLVPDTTNEENELALSILVSGRIIVPTPMHETDIQILLADVTDDTDHPMPVLCTVPDWQLEDSTAFCCRKYNGKIPRTDCLLTDWISVETIPAKTLSFPRKGDLTLQCIVSLISRQTDQELHSAAACLTYRNHNLGYIDASDNADQTELLTLSLAACVSGTSNPSDDAPVRVMDRWIERKVQLRPDELRQQHLNTLQNTFKACMAEITTSNDSCTGICSRLAGIATIVELFDAMELCLNIVAAGRLATPHQTEMITAIAEALDIDETKLRAMTQKALPLEIHQQPDLEFILGIHADMTDENLIKRLNEEYYKWNARVNHPDHAIRSQADQMIALIANARSNLTQPARS